MLARRRSATTRQREASALVPVTKPDAQPNGWGRGPLSVEVLCRPSAVAAQRREGRI